jgi:hypothetical protein
MLRPCWRCLRILGTPIGLVRQNHRRLPSHSNPASEVLQYLLCLDGTFVVLLARLLRAVNVVVGLYVVRVHVTPLYHAGLGKAEVALEGAAHDGAVEDVGALVAH